MYLTDNLRSLVVSQVGEYTQGKNLILVLFCVVYFERGDNKNLNPITFVGESLL